MKRIFLSVCLLAGCWISANAQQYSIVIKGGHVIDPKNNIDGIMDVALHGDTVKSVAKYIDPKLAMQVVDARGMYVTPGLIDMHSHNFFGTKMNQTYSNGPYALPPDGFTFRTGVTTVVDAGCAGWKSFDDFKKQTIAISKTRVLSFLNIVGEGMRGGTFEQNIADMDPVQTARVAKENPDYVVGIKLAHFNGHDWTPTEKAVEAGKLANIPVMIDFGGSTPVLSIEKLFMQHLRPGDIFTHCFGQLSSREPILDVKTGKIKSFVYEARKKGILFDVGYGGISFAFSQAIPAVKSGFYPNTISTDIHTGSMNAAMKDMPECDVQILGYGHGSSKCDQREHLAPAQAVHREELGSLTVGGLADIAVLRVLKGNFSMNDTGVFGFFDYTGTKITGKEKLECELTIRAGKIVYDLNGIASPLVVSKRN